MGLSQQTFIKNYNTPNGELEIKITYDNYRRPNDFLDFDIIDDIELEYGYEDEDQLTFYPNSVHCKFDDYKKRNYDILKSSIGDYNNSSPDKHMEYGGVEIRLDGTLKFKGYIDELSLRYSEKEMSVEFDVLCLTAELKNMSVDRSKIIGPDGSTIGENYAFQLIYAWYGVYKQLWGTEFPHITYLANLIDLPGLYGTFIKHDWKFIGTYQGNTITRDWNNLNDFWQTYFIMDSTDLYNDNRPCITWAEYLRLIALQFGAIIGVMDYCKVYFVKRFNNNNTPLDISDKIIDNNFSKEIHLPALQGVVIRNHWNGERSGEFGNIEKKSNGEYKYLNKVKTLDTYIGSYQDSGSAGTAIFADEYLLYPVWHVEDPVINEQGQCWELVGKWLYTTRMAPKDKIEVELTGINYNMVDTYRITPPDTNNLAVNFRAMTMKKCILKDKTNIVGIEV